MESSVLIPINAHTLEGELTVPDKARGLVLFAHGSGSGRLSPRNRSVAQVLNQAGIATLLFDLLTEEEDDVYENRFDIELLTNRLVDATRWVRQQPSTMKQHLGYFGASTGAAAALRAAAKLGAEIDAVVSRGGRPDLAMSHLGRVRAATLLIVGEYDDVVIELNQQAFELLGVSDKALVIVPGATHLFEEPGALEQVAAHAEAWFSRHLSDA
jgi:putative phosphoribosyl transferase